jgi:signal transduction histidine kinase
MGRGQQRLGENPTAGVDSAQGVLDEQQTELRRLADEQAALRRVATLVARGAPPGRVFAAVAEEVARVLRLPLVEIDRFDADGMARVIAAVGDHPFQPGTSWSLDDPSLNAMIRRTRRPARIDDYAQLPGPVGKVALSGGRRAVGAPIILAGAVWGTVAAGGPDDVPIPQHAEDRLAQFTELVATAIANTQAHTELRRLADEQAALRRLATLVAQNAEPALIFDAVCRETGRLFAATTVNLAHLTPDGRNVTMAGWSERDTHVPTGTRLPVGVGTINELVRRTRAPGRCDSYEGASGELAEMLRRRGVRSEVGAPVVVEGDIWGVLVAGTDAEAPLPPGTETQLADFAELIATAVYNASSRDELRASRARIVEAAYEQRRRVVRDLHDGAQQRLVQAVITLQLARRAADCAPDLATLLDEALEQAGAAVDELRELARGIHPAVLTHYGLAAAIEGLAERAPVPVTVDIAEAERYEATVESAAYFIAAEALTNVAKYAGARSARVSAARAGERLVLTVADDGVGGAAPADGSGLAGLQDRLAAIGGTVTIDSPAGGGTTIRAAIPLTQPK